MKLTIGMAHWEDFDGAYFTLQSIRLHHKLPAETEFIVVDTSPGGSAHSRGLLGMRDKLGGRLRYFHAPNPGGTTQPRNMVFNEARGEIVICTDCHVLFWEGAIERLVKWFDDHPDSRDLVQGPMVYDPLDSMSTHFADEWRSEMWGIWGTDELAIGTTNPQEINPSAPAFEIAQGLGCFAARKEDWLGFNPHFRGFGGEECYIHEKYRKAGRRALCLPAFRWVHRFYRPAGVTYELFRANKVRNYVLGKQELGEPLDEVYAHFVSSGQFPQTEWDLLVSDPVNYKSPSKRRNEIVLDGNPKPEPQVNGRMQVPATFTLDQAFDMIHARPRDLNEHMPTLKRFAGLVEHITEFSHRRESTLAFLASSPETLCSHQMEQDPLIDFCKKKAGDVDFKLDCADSLQSEIEPTDLLFIDTQHNANRLSNELLKHIDKVRRFLIVHDTEAFSWRGDDGGAGLFHSLQQLTKDRPEWFVALHDPKQHGLTVMSRNKEDLPPKLIRLWDPGYGPGTEVKKILESCGVTMPKDCECSQRMSTMNTWGADICEKQFDVVVGWMVDGAQAWGWNDKLKREEYNETIEEGGQKRSVTGVIFKALMTGIAFKLNPRDPFPGIVREGIKRGRKEEKKMEKIWNE